MTHDNRTEREFITLKNRECIHLPMLPRSAPPSIRGFGVSLDNAEAQSYLSVGLKVFGDQYGPYLMVRLRPDQEYPLVVDHKDVDVVIEPLAWGYQGRSGIICWLERVE